MNGCGCVVEYGKFMGKKLTVAGTGSLATGTLGCWWLLMVLYYLLTSESASTTTMLWTTRSIHGCRFISASSLLTWIHTLKFHVKMIWFVLANGCSKRRCIEDESALDSFAAIWLFWLLFLKRLIFIYVILRKYGTSSFLIDLLWKCWLLLSLYYWCLNDIRIW